MWTAGIAAATARNPVSEHHSKARITSQNRRDAADRELRKHPVILGSSLKEEHPITGEELYKLSDRFLPPDLECPTVLLQQREFVGVVVGEPPQHDIVLIQSL
jgi:hypothetical protein